ncbi:hypothetical protein HJG60_008036 [Phyllostomus discolor]|uniref:Uncharacterized protein n=1 Tax=Phyllostomus discolor TaxID=89673 RepID=A0A834EVX9_9CHIR|nr:hypothetical protein HJG60_008036 [Phyllostomus discolor]
MGGGHPGTFPVEKDTFPGTWSSPCHLLPHPFTGVGVVHPVEPWKPALRLHTPPAAQLLAHWDPVCPAPRHPWQAGVLQPPVPHLDNASDRGFLVGSRSLRTQPLRSISGPFSALTLVHSDGLAVTTVPLWMEKPSRVLLSSVRSEECGQGDRETGAMDWGKCEGVTAGPLGLRCDLNSLAQRFFFLVL